MREWFEAQLAAGLPAFAGSAISGTVAIKQELINELLAKWLIDNARSSDAKPTLDFGKTAGVVKQAAVRAETGTLLIDFEIAV
jgi:hypothetical protein